VNLINVEEQRGWSLVCTDVRAAARMARGKAGCADRVGYVERLRRCARRGNPRTRALMAERV
jgi:hypothetical protein